MVSESAIAIRALPLVCFSDSAPFAAAVPDLGAHYPLLLRFHAILSPSVISVGQSKFPPEIIARALSIALRMVRFGSQNYPNYC